LILIVARAWTTTTRTVVAMPSIKFKARTRIGPRMSIPNIGIMTS
jgi:hypothetical protein